MDGMPDFFCYFNGEILSCNKISLSPYDLGFLRGYAVFDVMSTENGKPFLWERHFDRLCLSAQALNLRVPVSGDEYRNILNELIIRNQEKNISFRTVLSGGTSADSFVPQPGEETFLVLAEAAHTYPAKQYEEGVTAITLEYERSLPQVKLANHAIAISDLPRRKEAGAFEAIYVNNGQISEASQSNVFIVKNGSIVTTWENVLHGITQGLVLELAEKISLVAQKGAISLEELMNADEVFVTGSSKRIMPVVRIDERVIGTGGVPGPVTRQLMEALDDFVVHY